MARSARRCGLRHAVLAALAAALPRAAAGPDTHTAALSLFRDVEEPAGVRCEYACAAGACHRLLDCTPRDGSDEAGCTPTDGGALCVALAITCAECPASSSVAAPPSAPLAAPATQRPRRRLAADADAPLSELAAAAAALASAPDAPGCEGAVPRGVSLITYTNAHHFDVLLLQRRVATENGQQCLLTRTVTLCLDDACMPLCAEHGVTCLRYAGYTLGKADADSRSVDYRTITFVKWLILQEVIDHVSSAFFFDDDVLLMGNPWPALDVGGFDLRHQAEKGAGCLAQPNGGLLYVRSTPAGKALLREMVARKSIIEARGDKLDQDYVAEAVVAANASRCALPRAHFAGHCPGAQHAGAPMRGVLTYHAHCCGERDAKVGLLTRVAAARRATPEARFADVDRKPLPGLTVLTDSCYYPYRSDLRGLRRAWAKVDAALPRPSWLA